MKSQVYQQSNQNATQNDKIATDPVKDDSINSDERGVKLTHEHLTNLTSN